MDCVEGISETSLSPVRLREESSVARKAEVSSTRLGSIPSRAGAGTPVVFDFPSIQYSWVRQLQRCHHGEGCRFLEKSLIKNSGVEVTGDRAFQAFAHGSGILDGAWVYVGETHGFDVDISEQMIVGDEVLAIDGEHSVQCWIVPVYFGRTNAQSGNERRVPVLMVSSQTSSKAARAEASKRGEVKGAHRGEWVQHGWQMNRSGLLGEVGQS
jgi:hypothetical protein